MPIDAGLARKAYPDRLKTDNKVEMDSGDYEGKIHDVFVVYVKYEENGQATWLKSKEGAEEQRVMFTVTLDNSEPLIALRLDLPIRISKRSKYSEVITSLTAITDLDAQMEYDPKDLIDADVIVSVEYELKSRKKPPFDDYPWSKITALRRRQPLLKRPKPVTSETVQPGLEKARAVAAGLPDRREDFNERVDELVDDFDVPF